jgi:hypothetical protein
LLGRTLPRAGITTYYIDTRLPFGHAKAPEAFCRIAAAVRAMMAAQGYQATVNYVADFSLVEGSVEECDAACHALACLLPSLGFEENLPKRCPPATQQIFLGLLYNTAAPGPHPMTITVPEDKLRRAEHISSFPLSACQCTYRSPRSSLLLGSSTTSAMPSGQLVLSADA